MERRYHSPYRHWVSGFAFEVLCLAAFISALGLVALVAHRLAG